MEDNSQLVQLHDQWEGSVEEQDRKAAFTEAVQRFKMLESPTANDCHLMGYMYYSYDFGEASYYKAQALKLFERALTIEKNHFLARLYLAHCRHDQQHFEAALANYQLVNQAELKAFQAWRYVKLIEQIGYCLWQLNRKEEALSHFEQVLWYYQHESDEFFAHPYEMEQCLEPAHRLVKAIKETPHYW